MKEKTYFPEEHEVRHRKKSRAKGQPRADHKHLYETVLLTRKYRGTDFKTGRPKITTTQLPTRVCTICGRINNTDHDAKYYVSSLIPNMPFETYESQLSQTALELPEWLAEDFWDKFAKKL